ncbi:MAG TPA: hypothetical protein VGE40_04605 [Bacilli bacterium]
MLQYLSGCALLCFTFIALYHFMISLPRRKRRWLIRKHHHLYKQKQFSPLLLRWLWITNNNRMQERQQLLVGCGLPLDVSLYFVVKRLLFIVIIGFSLLVYTAMRWGLPLFFQPQYLVVFIIAAMFLLIFDKMVLEVLRKQRSQRIINEVYILSNQLLYYSGSSMNLHNKLTRCIPFTSRIRNELSLLVNEWYEDADLAINRFKTRLGTEEGHSFAETINSLRLYDTDHFYDLLRQRILDYKEKIELMKESKKETTSYLLFIIAGLPILNVFRIFIYPWVAEGKKLFDSLN